MIFLDGAELETDRTPGVVLVMGEVDTFASVRIIAGLTERSASLYEASSSSSSSCYCSERGRIDLLTESRMGEVQLSHVRWGAGWGRLCREWLGGLVGWVVGRV